MKELHATCGGRVGWGTSVTNIGLRFMLATLHCAGDPDGIACLKRPCVLQREELTGANVLRGVAQTKARWGIVLRPSP